LFHIIGCDKRDALLFRQKASRIVVQHSKIDLVMPGSGQNENPPFSGVCQLPPAADMRRICSGRLCAKNGCEQLQQTALLFDHFVGDGEQHRRDFWAKCARAVLR
jgi:hypothetical protein